MFFVIFGSLFVACGIGGFEGGDRVFPIGVGFGDDFCFLLASFKECVGEFCELFRIVSGFVCLGLWDVCRLLVGLLLTILLAL